MSIGDAWGAGMGQMNKDSSFKLLDAFYEAGGNFIDTANNYQDEASEEYSGEWMEKRGIRDQIVIATKVGGFSGPNEVSRIYADRSVTLRAVHHRLQEGQEGY